MSKTSGSRRYVGFNERYKGKPSKPGNKQDAYGAAPPTQAVATGPPYVLVNDPDFTLYVGDVLEQLRELPDESVHCVVTSPPYWGLRDYGTGSWDGGDPDCDHIREVNNRGTRDCREGWQGEFRATAAPLPVAYSDLCGKCGATRTDHQLGLEATPDLFVARMVEVFREVRRVLRADGTCWVNLGDTYAQGGGTKVDAEGGLKPKDLCGIPWRVAFALQADGWYLRSDIIWAKPNPMPESVTDRPTKAHEYVFLLTKGPRYFFDADAVREAHKEPWRGHGEAEKNNWSGYFDGVRGSSETIRLYNPAGRNVRSVWEIATQPYPEAHFATFPEALPERCIKAGTSERGCCPACGAPWERETVAHPDERKPYRSVGTGPKADEVRADGNRKNRVLLEDGSGGSLAITRRETVGWQASCRCGSTHVSRSAPFPHPVPCTVLDPFMGSGTTALVARRLGRRSIGIELNPDYANLCARRLQQLSLFAGDAS